MKKESVVFFIVLFTIVFAFLASVPSYGAQTKEEKFDYTLMEIEVDRLYFILAAQEFRKVDRVLQNLYGGLKELAKKYSINSVIPLTGRSGDANPTAALLVFVEAKR